MRRQGIHGTDPAVRRLIEWMGRPDWTELYDKVVDRHVSAVLEDFEIESVEELAHRIGQDLYIRAVFAATFEDFLTVPNDAGETIVDEYLRRRGYRESVPRKRYLEALRDSVMSLYEVIQSAPGSHLVLRDRLRGGEPVRVEERSGSRDLVKWDRLAARVVPFQRRWVLSGAPLLLEPKMADLAEQILSKVVLRLGRTLQQAIDDLMAGPEPDDERMAEIVAKALAEDEADPLDEDEAEQPINDEERAILWDMAMPRTAPVFTRLWLTQTLDRLTAPPPQMRNTDGDELVFVETRWPINEGKLPKVVRRIEREEDRRLFRYSEGEWHWSWQDDPRLGGPQQESAGSTAGKGPASLSLATIAVNPDGEAADRVSLGSILIEGSEIVLRVNSLERAERGKAMIEALLGDGIGAAASTQESFEAYRQRTADDPPLPPEEPKDLTPEDKMRVLGEMLDRHYRDWPDVALPALDGKTPREAAKTLDGRGRLAKLLRQMENQEERRVRRDGGPAYDFGRLRRELGIDEAEG